MPYIVLVPFMDEEWNPADFVLDIDELELREARGDTAEDEIEERVGSIGELGIDGCFEDIESLALKAAVVESRQDVQVHRHVQVLRGLPERIVIVARKWQMLRRYLPDQTPNQPCLLAPFQLLDGVFDIIQRDHRNPDQPSRRHFAVLDQPVISDMKTGFLHFGIFQGKKTKPKGGIEHLGRYAIDLHLTQTRLGIPATGLFTGGISRRELGEFLF